MCVVVSVIIVVCVVVSVIIVVCVCLCCVLVNCLLNAFAICVGDVTESYVVVVVRCVVL